jgi:O-antigen/teichoic acid export membrane protein
MGIGQSLRNKLTFFAAFKDKETSARLYFFSSLNFYFTVAGLLAVGACVASRFLPWPQILGEEMVPLHDSAALVFSGISLVLFLSLAFSLGDFGLHGYQESYVSALMDVARSFFILLFSALACALYSGVVWILLAYFWGFLSAAVLSLYLFLHFRKWKWVIPTFRETMGVWRDLRVSGSGFFILQISAVIVLYTGAILVTSLEGFGLAGEYALVQKLFLYLIVIHTMVLVPAWSAFTDAHVRGDFPWFRRMFWRVFSLTLLVTGVGGVLLSTVGLELIHVWTGKWMTDKALFPLMALWVFVYGWSNCFSLPLNAVGKVHRQAILSLMGAVVHIPLALYGGKMWGSLGVCGAAILVLFPVAISNTLEVRSLLKTHAH